MKIGKGSSIKNTFTQKRSSKMPWRTCCPVSVLQTGQANAGAASNSARRSAVAATRRNLSTEVDRISLTFLIGRTAAESYPENPDIKHSCNTSRQKVTGRVEGEQEGTIMAVGEMLPSTKERVAVNTAAEVKERLREETVARLERYQGARRAEIDARLAELDREWDIERTLQTNMSVVLLTSLALGYTTSRKWFGFAGAVAGFFLQHGLQGWCPPVVPWRRAGVRTMAEIEAERTALRFFRGDFQPTQDPDAALAQANRG